MEYASWLLQLGEGRIPHEPAAAYTDAIRLPPSMCVNSKEDLLEKVYGDVNDILRGHTASGNEGRLQDYLANRTILTTRNEDVDSLNEQIVNKV